MVGECDQPVLALCNSGLLWLLDGFRAELNSGNIATGARTEDNEVVSVRHINSSNQILGWFYDDKPASKGKRVRGQ